MPKNIKPTRAQERVADRIVEAARHVGRGGPFTKHQQKVVTEVREVVRKGIFEGPRG